MKLINLKEAVTKWTARVLFVTLIVPTVLYFPVFGGYLFVATLIGYEKLSGFDRIWANFGGFFMLCVGVFLIFYFLYLFGANLTMPTWALRAVATIFGLFYGVMLPFFFFPFSGPISDKQSGPLYSGGYAVATGLENLLFLLLIFALPWVAFAWGISPLVRRLRRPRFNAESNVDISPMQDDNPITSSTKMGQMLTADPPSIAKAICPPIDSFQQIDNIPVELPTLLFVINTEKNKQYDVQVWFTKNVLPALSALTQPLNATTHWFNIHSALKSSDLAKYLEDNKLRKQGCFLFLDSEIIAYKLIEITPAMNAEKVIAIAKEVLCRLKDTPGRMSV